jgi:hypothetical protein
MTTISAPNQHTHDDTAVCEVLELSGKLLSSTPVVLDDDINHRNRDVVALLVLQQGGTFDVITRSDGGTEFIPAGTLTWTVARAPGEVDVDALRQDLLPGGQLCDAAARVVAGYSVEWDGRNLAAHLTPDARDASETIAEFLSCAGDQYLTGREIVDAAAWLYERAHGELTGDEGDDELEALAETWEAEARQDGFVLVGDVLEFLQAIRNEKAADVEAQ